MEESGGWTENRVDARSIEKLVQARVIRGGVHFHSYAQSPSVPLPRELLPAASYFTDRVDLLEDLTDRWRDAWRNGDPLVVLLVGPGGIGKSELAAKWLRQIAAEVPGPHLYADMNEKGPKAAGEALGGFLRAMGVPAGEIPREAGDRSALFLSLTSEDPVIVWLDDVVLASQIRFLRPNSAGSVVVATAREVPANLAGVVPVHLGPMGDDAALEMLKRLVGRTEIEESRARAVVDLCRGRPFALYSAGLQMICRGSAVREVHGGRARLGESDIGDDGIMTSVLDEGYRGVTPGAARTYRCLSALLGRYFSAEMASAVAGGGDPREALAELAAAGLIMDYGDGLYGFHELAFEHACAQASEKEHESALRRLVEWYLRVTVAADYSVMPARWRLGPEYERYRGSPPPMDEGTAWAWLENERPQLLAAVRAAAERGWNRLLVQLAEAQWSLCFLGKYPEQGVSVFGAGRDAAIELKDLRFEGRMRCQIGFAFMDLGRLDDAAGEFGLARDADRLAGHTRGEATAVESLGLLELMRSGAEELPDLTSREAEFAHASLGLLTDNLTLNLRMAAQDENDRAVALAWRHRGRALSATGDHEAAIEHLVRAVELIKAVGDPYNAGRALAGLGQAYLRAGRIAEAIPVLTGALDIQHARQNRVEEAVVLETLSAAAQRSGDGEGAAAWLRRALTVLEGRHNSRAEAVRVRLAELTDLP